MEAVASSINTTHIGQPSSRVATTQTGAARTMTSRKLFSRSRKPAPPAPSSSDYTTSSGFGTNGHAHSGSHFSIGSTNSHTQEEKVFSSTDTNHSTSALSSVSTSSRTSRFFRRFTRTKPPPVPSLPPALILDLDAGTALPRTSDHPQPTSASRSYTNATTPQPTAAAAIIAESNAAYASAKPAHLQPRKMLDALTNARLDVEQTRDLVRMCGLQIRERGLDTPGLFRSFRIAESHERVETMIQLFLLSIDISTYIAVFPILPENALDRLERSGSSKDAGQGKSRLAREELDKELRYASPHDVVSVLKWGLRHMRLRCSDFNSKDSDEWYSSFVSSERQSGYQPRAIADFLHPQLPQATAELLSEVLDLMASVAAHSSSNHMPASALCKVLGFWLLGRVGVAHPPPTFDELSSAVGKATAMVEHLLLAHIRSQAAVTFAMPLRLTELLHKYPYIKQGRETPSLPPAFASRPVPTLRIDMKSENLIVSQAKPRAPSSILADALDAQAAESLEGGKGELWAQIIMSVDSEGAANGRGYGLLIDEHVRILRKVDDALLANSVEEGGKHSTLVEAANAAAAATPAPSITGAAASPAEIRASRRRSQSLSDLRSNLPPYANRPLFPLPESGTTTPRGAASPAPKASTPKRKPVPLLHPPSAEPIEVVSDQPAAAHQSDLFGGGLEPSASWRSFSEEGFGVMSTASSDLSLTELDLRPSLQSLPSRRSQRSLYRVRSTTSNGSRRKTAFPLPPTSTEAEGAGVKKTHTVTRATLTELDTAFGVLWQDQLLDSSPCASFPSLLFVQLNPRTASSLSTTSGLEEGERPLYPGETICLLIVDNIIPPRPPTPPPSAGNKGRGGWDSDSQWGERRSIFGAQSIKSVKMRLRRVSTVIGNGVGRSRKQQEKYDEVRRDKEAGNSDLNPRAVPIAERGM